MVWKTSNKHISSSKIVHQTTVMSNGLTHNGPWTKSIGDNGLGDNKMCQAWWMKWLFNVYNFDKILHGGVGSSGDAWMDGFPLAHNIFSSLSGGISWAWMLPSNKSYPLGSPKNLANIVDFVDFLAWPPMKKIGKKNLTTISCLPSWLIVDSFLPKVQITLKRYNVIPPTNTSYDVACVTTTWIHTMV